MVPSQSSNAAAGRVRAVLRWQQRAEEPTIEPLPTQPLAAAMGDKFITSGMRLRVSMAEIVFITDRLLLTGGRAEFPAKISPRVRVTEL
jgi:hypothetical protein